MRGKARRREVRPVRVGFEIRSAWPSCFRGRRFYFSFVKRRSRLGWLNGKEQGDRMASPGNLSSLRGEVESGREIDRPRPRRPSLFFPSSQLYSTASLCGIKLKNQESPPDENRSSKTSSFLPLGGSKHKRTLRLISSLSPSFPSRPPGHEFTKLCSISSRFEISEGIREGRGRREGRNEP